MTAETGLHPPDGFVYASLPQLMALEHHSRGLSFLSRQPLSSILSGAHASRLRGRGLSFDELRNYTPGDDLRHLDARATLRYGKPFVRTFTEERDRPTLLLVDQRMNMYFGSRHCFKSVAAAQLASSVPGWRFMPATGSAAWSLAMRRWNISAPSAAAPASKPCAPP